MEELIAKRYITALKNAIQPQAFEALVSVFATLAKAFDNKKFEQVVMSPSVSQEDKRTILIEAVKGVKSKELENLLALLIENGRIGIIPTMAETMRKELASQKNSYNGKVYSDTNIDAAVIENLAVGLHKKLGATIALESVPSDYNGVKVQVEDLGIEINFSKNRLNSQLIDHILKAI